MPLLVIASNSRELIRGKGARNIHLLFFGLLNVIFHFFRIFALSFGRHRVMFGMLGLPTSLLSSSYQTVMKMFADSKARYIESLL